MATGSDGSLYVCDPDLQRVVRLTADGQQVANFTYHLSGTSLPYSLATFRPESVSVSFYGAVEVVVVVDSSYNVVLLLSTADLHLLSVVQQDHTHVISMATGVAVDAAGRLYLADTGHSRVLVYKPDTSTAFGYDLQYVWNTAAMTRPAKLAVNANATRVYVISDNSLVVLAGPGLPAGQ